MQERLPPAGSPAHARLIDIPGAFAESGVRALFAELGGAVFAEGAYRIHDPAHASKWTDLAVIAFPDLRQRIFSFASDWLGRQFALTTEAAPTGGLGVLLIDVQSDDVLHTDRDLDGFHDELLADDPEPALALELFAGWRSAGGAAPAPTECVAYDVPIYLGGADTFTNMSVTDMEVAWDLGGQLLRQVRELPEGTPIDIDVV